MNLLLGAAFIFLITTVIARTISQKGQRLLSEDERLKSDEIARKLRVYLLWAVMILIGAFMLLVSLNLFGQAGLTVGYMAAYALMMILYYGWSYRLYKQAGFPGAFLKSWVSANLLRLIGLGILVAAFAVYFLQQKPA